MTGRIEEEIAELSRELDDWTEAMSHPVRSAIVEFLREHGATGSRELAEQIEAACRGASGTFSTVG
jgi:hypothetical protein